MAALWIVWSDFSVAFNFFQDFESGLIFVYKAFQDALLKNVVEECICKKHMGVFHNCAVLGKHLKCNLPESGKFRGGL